MELLHSPPRPANSADKTPSPNHPTPPSPTSSPALPPELLLLVVDAVLPPNPQQLLPASHPATKTLLALTRVSRATYARATRLLRQRCVFVDSARRLADVLLCVPRLVPALPPVLSLRHMTALYLAPFGASLDDLPTAAWVRELFCEVCETLRRLVVQMPFGSLDPLDDGHLGVRRTLREGFEQLHRLEEFACLGSYPALSVPEGNTDVWRLWPSLRRLVLFGVPMDSHWLWWDIATLPLLEHVDEYFHKLPRDDARLGRDIKVVLMDLVYDLGVVRTERWGEIDPEEKMTVEVFEVPLPFYGDETPLQLVTEWARRGALDGSVWRLDGTKVRGEGGGTTGGD
ncbi:hypothetical protein BBK36DRAFT_1179683 [Trichoderma citrinoviride]|uniref:Uncharacterized protein n=1 Tax=Trichoderma citrinoviride TaxID=58853 RepID=A0A2T4B5K3_9HYPO|nr:hypothetical protein BBK36DRAFT_1179683 [Trichoderma citrinoviride]PTB64491.1 hypothetical protein BBK36DRAFT_1179683 [Trichoderma citrinoviride]